MGLISHGRSSDEDVAVTARTMPRISEKSELLRQHGVEYWMMASLLYEEGKEEEQREAVRVTDPEAADAFFVPFFSSWSYDIHGRKITGREIDRQLQVYTNTDYVNFQTKIFRKGP